MRRILEKREPEIEAWKLDIQVLIDPYVEVPHPATFEAG
jgi:hypothetical protein